MDKKYAHIYVLILGQKDWAALTQNGPTFMDTTERLNSHKQNIIGGGKQIVFSTSFGRRCIIMVSILI